MVDRDVVFGKLAVVDRCVGRIHAVRERTDGLTDVDRQDICLINLQRAIQATLDLAGHVVATEGYGAPDKLATTFTLIEQNGKLDPRLAESLRRMVGFRNVAVHQYQDVDPDIVEAIVTRHLGDLRAFAEVVIGTFGLREA